MLEWARAELGVALQTTDSIFGAEVPEQQLEVVADYLHGESRRRGGGEGAAARSAPRCELSPLVA